MTAFRPTTIEGATAAHSNEAKGAPPPRGSAPAPRGSPQASRDAGYQTNFALSVTMRRPQLLVFVPKLALLMLATGMP